MANGVPRAAAARELAAIAVWTWGYGRSVRGQHRNLLLEGAVVLIAADSQAGAQTPSLASVARDQVVLNGAG
ncbi:hypothetical protein [Fontivita pretiosa]|jgi:hypothetical protein|uniref:hypothetical protein n=1 Tax=Fontivita pretiosa TaxID=2989684 RepID=UPI003D17B753